MGVNRPQVVAHRGASSKHPEHTLAAYKAALDAGADGLECDVRLTADGHLVCLHDRTLRRTAEVEGNVSTMTLNELDALDFATWKRPWADLDDEREEIRREEHTVLTLRSLLELADAHPGRVEMAIETKHPTRYGGLVEDRLAHLLNEFGWTGADSPARVMSFSWIALRRMRAHFPDLPVVQIFDTLGDWQRARPFLESDVIAAPGIEVLHRKPKAIARIGRSHRLHCWTVDTQSDVDLCRDLGVEALITNVPSQIRRYLDRGKWPTS